jgi:hypothetical protein
MSYQTVEVELDHGSVRPCGTEKLPARSRALLTLLDPVSVSAAPTCAELAERWPKLEKLSPEEAAAFADDLEKARAKVPPLKPAWD